MTEQPTAPAAPPAPAPAAPAPSAPPAAPPPPAAPSATDPAAEVARLQAELDKVRGHSRTWEERAKANENAAPLLEQITKAMGLDKPDPAVVAQQLAAAQAEKSALARENAVILAAQAAGANAAALIDSKAFSRQIESIDPNDRAAITAAVQAAVTANPQYAATAPAAPAATAPVRQANTPTDFNGSPGGQRQWTAEDVKRATPAAAQKAMQAGLLNDYLNS